MAQKLRGEEAGGVERDGQTQILGINCGLQF
jgi:hypothetical protein